jgi:hypothetical protein
VASLGAFIKLFTQPPSPAEFIDPPDTVQGGVNLLALAAAERQTQDEQGPSFRTVDPMADFNESQRVGAFNALQNIPNSPLAGLVAMVPGGAYETMTRSPEGANPEVPNMLAAMDQMSLGGLVEGNVLGGVMRTKPAEPVGPPARLRGRPAGSLGELGTADPFYSQVRTVVDDPKTQGTQTGEAWLKFLTDPKRGVKAEELQYTGLGDLLKGKAGQRVTREEINSHLDANEIEVKEVTKGARGINPEDIQKADEEMRRTGIVMRGNRTPENVEAFNAAVERYESLKLDHEGDKRETKFSQYTLPGAKNYREVLLTLPERPKEQRRLSFEEWRDKHFPDWQEMGMSDATARARWKIAREQGAAELTHPDTSFRGGHWDEPNVLAHLRLSDREVGGKRTLLVEEIQSDWAQKGRKEGFEAKLTPEQETEQRDLRIEAEKLRNFSLNAALDRSSRRQADARFDEIQTRLREIKNPNAVPFGPFVGDTSKWTALGLKRVLKMAADEGYDSIGIVPGVEQAKRYDLSKQISRLKITPVTDQGGLGYEVKAYQHDNNRIINRVVRENELADNIGKELADRVVRESGGKKPVEYEGLDLKVGGEGMKGYYDKIVPETLNKLAKEYGVKVQIEGGEVKTGAPSGGWVVTRQADQTELGRYKSKEEALKAMDAEAKEGGWTRQEYNLEPESTPTPIHTLEVPEHMKKAIKSKGFPLYSSLQGKTIGDLANV